MEHLKMKLTPIASNMTEVKTAGGSIVLFSYSTPVAALLPSGQYWRTKKWYSVTTTRHINKWLKGVLANVEEVEQEQIEGLV